MGLIMNVVRLWLLILIFQLGMQVFCQVDKNVHRAHSGKTAVKWEGSSPELKISAYSIDDGWLVTVEASGFQFAPEMAGRGHSPGKGHMHLYVSGQKHTRLYGRSYFLNGLSAFLSSFELK